MRARFPLALVFAVVAAWTLVLASPAARAQTTSSGPSVNEIVGVVQRLEPNGVSADNPGENPHPSGVLVSDINFEDCDANLQYEFDLSISSLTSISGYNLDVWAGTADCSQLANRQAATAVCWPVKTPFAPNSNPQTVTVWMRDIVSQVFQASHTVTYSGTEAPASVCQLQTTTGPTNISLYFFFEQAANATGNEATYPVTVAMRAGDVQGDISIGIGQDLLVANIPPTTDTNVQGWNVYCDPPPGPVGSEGIELVPVDAPSNNGHCPAQVPDTGVVSSSVDSSGVDANDDSSVASSVDSAVPIVLDEAGGNACGVQLNDANIPSPGGCSASAVLVPGGGTTGTATVDEAGNEIFEEASTTATDEAGVSISGGTMKLPLPSQYLCGTGGVSSTQVNLLNLRDGVYYNVAVAAVDAYGNVGPLSNVACGEPRPVNDFWKLYYEAGGRAGGGFCSAEGVGTPAGTSGLGALMIASIVAMVRRRRRK
jgi:hypothetical protein